MDAESIAALKQQIEGDFNDILQMIKEKPLYRKLRNAILETLTTSKSKVDTAFLHSSELRNLLLETKQNINSVGSVTKLLKVLKSHKATKAARFTDDAINSGNEGAVSTDQQAAAAPQLTVNGESHPSTSNTRRRSEMRPEQASDSDIKKLEDYLAKLNEEIKTLETSDVSIDEMDDVYCRLTKLRQVGSKWSRWFDKAKAHRSSQIAQPADVTALPSSSNSATNSNVAPNGANTHSNGTSDTQLDETATSVVMVGQTVTNGSVAQLSAVTVPKVAKCEGTITRAMEKPIRFSEIEHNRAERKFREFIDQKARDQLIKHEIIGLTEHQKERFRKVLSWFNKYMRSSGVINKRLPFEAPDFELTLERFLKIAKSQQDDVKSSSSLGASASASASAIADVEVHSDRAGSSTKAVPGWLFEEASVFFSRARNAIVQRRRRDNISRFRTYWEHDDTNRDDPALHDPELEAKLNANSLEQELVVDKLVDAFAQRENDPLLEVNVSHTDGASISLQPQNADVKNPLKETEIVPDPVRLLGDVSEKEAPIADINNHTTETESDVEIIEPKTSNVQLELEAYSASNSARRYSDSDDDDDFATVKVSSQTVKVRFGMNSTRKTRRPMLSAEATSAKRARILNTSTNENPVIIRDDDDAISDRPASTSSNGAPLPKLCIGIETESAIVISDDDD